MPELILTIIFWAATCLQAPAGSYLWLQHAPTSVAIPLLFWLVRTNRIDRLSLRCALVFICLHCIGARWIYSYVPYDDALTRIFSTDTEAIFGWTRNNYDRFVHTMYGVCFAPIAWRIHSQRGDSVGIGRWTAAWLAIEWVLASSALYEIAEWLVAITMAPDWADSYLGQQGDTWDAMKDMALAGCGATLAMAVAVFTAPVSAWLRNLHASLRAIPPTTATRHP